MSQPPVPSHPPMHSIHPPPIEDSDLLNRFTYHAPTKEQIPVFEMVRKQGLEFAMAIVDHCPPSRETSLAITKIEEAVMHANSAIARHGLRSSE